MERVRRLRMVSQAIPGRPRVAVLPHYEGTPSVAGRGRTNAGEIPRDACPAEFAWSRGERNRRQRSAVGHFGLLMPCGLQSACSGSGEIRKAN